MKILVIRFSSIGDIILTTPVLRCLKAQIPNVEIHYLTKSSFAELISSNPHIDSVHVLKESLNDIIAQLRSEQFDFVVDLHNNYRSTRVKRSLGVRSSSLDKRNAEKWKMVNLKWLAPSEVEHVVKRYLLTVKELGVSDDGNGLDLHIPEAQMVSAKEFPVSHQHGFVGLAIGASAFTKKMPLHLLVELCRLIDHPIVLIGGPSDAAIGQQIQSEVGSLIHDCTGRYSIIGSASILAKSSVVICHDSGAMHLSCALSKPTISIWGNTVVGFGFGPYQPLGPEQTHVNEVLDLSCRPCSKLGQDRCPKGHFRCMENQDLQAIARTARSYLI